MSDPNHPSGDQGPAPRATAVAFDVAWERVRMSAERPTPSPKPFRTSSRNVSILARRILAAIASHDRDVTRAEGSFDHAIQRERRRMTRSEEWERRKFTAFRARMHRIAAWKYTVLVVKATLRAMHQALRAVARAIRAVARAFAAVGIALVWVVFMAVQFLLTLFNPKTSDDERPKRRGGS
jgi:hypothetical protein